MTKVNREVEETEKIKTYLFNTNLRWSFIHTTILQQFPISVSQKNEYNKAIEDTLSLLSQTRNDLLREIMEEMPKKRERTGANAQDVENWGFNHAIDQVNTLLQSKL